MTSVLTRISEAVRKFGNFQAVPSTSRSTGTTQDPSDAAYQPLATVAPEQTEPLQIVEGAEMGFDEQYEKPEGREGDAFAQVVAFVRYLPLSCRYGDIDSGVGRCAHRLQSSIAVCHILTALLVSFTLP